MSLLSRPGEPHPINELIPLVDKLLDAMLKEAAGHALVLSSIRPDAKGDPIVADHPLATEINVIVALGGYGDAPLEALGRQSPWLALEVFDSLRMTSQVLGFEDPQFGRHAAKVLTELSVFHEDQNITAQALSSLASRVSSMGVFGQADSLFTAAQARFVSLRTEVAASICERYAYLLTAQEDYRAARMQANFFERFGTDNNVDGHPLGKIHLAYAHLYAAASQINMAVDSYKKALPLLDPARDFGACFQATFNIAMMFSDHDEHSQATKILGRLRTASPFLENSMPMLHLDWADGLLLARQDHFDKAAVTIEGMRGHLPRAYRTYWLRASVHLASLYAQLNNQPAMEKLGDELAVFLDQDQQEVLPRETWLASQFSYIMQDGGPRINELSFLNRKLVLRCHLA